ncbi:hypothetical protein TWF481_003174 [Arthrobotrys musiformis]|uniref:BTB domain-containing protein n=1 Tax=Arthrobotrys musiformis TaxID=47236 RepID=A0AAV9VRG0_9PEZI
MSLDTRHHHNIIIDLNVTRQQARNINTPITGIHWENQTGKANIEDVPDENLTMASSNTTLGARAAPDLVVLVGAAEERFTVYSGTFMTVSKYFAGALRPGAFKESYERIIRLPEVEPQAFRNILEWANSPTRHHSLEARNLMSATCAFEVADYLLIDSYKADVISYIAYRVAECLPERYWMQGQTPRRYKALHPERAIAIISSLFQYCQALDMPHIRRCLCLIAAGYFSLNLPARRMTGASIPLTEMWDAARTGISNHETCKKCTSYIGLTALHARFRMPEQNKECICWRKYFWGRSYIHTRYS